jgi:hypothetical protein
MKSAVFWDVTPCGSCKNLLTRAIRRNVPEDGIFQKIMEHLAENFQKLDTERMTESLTSDNPPISPLTNIGKTATTQEKLNAFAGTLEHIATNSGVECTVGVSTVQVVNDFPEQALADRMRATNHSEIAWIVCHVKLRKAAAPEGIPNIIRQHLLRLVLKWISKLFNTSLALNDFLRNGKWLNCSATEARQRSRVLTELYTSVPIEFFRRII